MAISDRIKNELAKSGNRTVSKVRTTSSTSKNVDDVASIISQRMKKISLNNNIKLDTLQSDLASLSTKIDSVYNGWQSRETMENTRLSVQNMYNRLGKYQDYQKAYGGTDLSQLHTAYKSVLDSWDDVASHYGQYKDADSYNKAIEKTKKEAEAYEGMTKADLNALQTEIADLEEIYKTAQQHDSKVKGLTRRGANFDSRARGKGTIADKITTAENELNEFLGSYGYESADALKNALDEKKLYFDNAKRIQDGIALAEKESAMASSAQATEGLKKWDEFVAGRDKERTEGYKEPAWVKGMRYHNDPMAQVMDLKREDTSYQEPQDDWTQEERNIFGAYYLENPESAYDYAARLNNQKALAEKEKGKQKYSDKATSGVGSEILHTAGAVLTSPLAMADYLDDVTDIAAGRRTIVEEGAVSPFDYSQAVTSGVSNKLNNMYGTLSEDIPIIGGKGVGDVYGLGTSILQSAVSASTLGPYGTLISYFGQGAASATDDALARGADAEQALMYGTIVGAAEGVSEMIGIDNLLKVGKASTLKGFFKNVLKQSGAEELEEGFSSVVDKIADNFVMKDKSNLNTMVSRLVAQGMSYEEAKNKAWLESVEEVAFDVLSGAISGAFHAAPRTAAATAMSHFSEVNAGKNIRANDRIGEVFDIASNPEAASAYEAYTEYANKGINAENVSDAQLGKLAYEAVEEAYNIINSETATAEQKAQARKTIADLEVFAQKTPGRVSKKEAKKYDDDMVQGIIDAGLDNDTNSESYRLAMEYDAKVKSGKKLTTAEISKLVEANEMAYRNEDAKAVTDRLTELGETADVPEVARIIERKMNREAITADEYQAVKDSKYGNQVLLENTDADIVSQAEAMETDDGELFLRLYDGKTDAEAYANSFNLVAEYAKAPSISTDYVLEHRGVLTPSQTSQIYNHFAVKASKEAKIASKEAKIKFDQEAQEQFNDAIAKMEENLKVSREGFVDTSVIDFTNSSAEGKVNWKDLKPRQQQAVTFVSGLFKAMGANVVFVDKTKKFNGMYHQEGDTVFVDVYAGMDIVNMMGKDSIIPTTAHELTHMMEVHSPGEFKELADMVLDFLSETKHLTRQELIANEMARLDEKHSDDAPHSEKDAISEIVARACEDMLSASKEGRRLFESLSEEQQKSFADKVKEIFKKLTEWLDKLLNSYESTSDEAKAIRGVKSVFDEVSARWDKMLADIAGGNTADAQTEIASIGSRDLSDLSGAVGLDGKSLFQYRAFEADKDIYREMLLKHKDVIGITDLQIVELFGTIDKAVNIIRNNLEALDYAWEADIDDRAFSPVKPNSDNLYKVSLDFSTLCRKRLLQQTIQATLQETLNKQLSKEEAIAIRDELMKLQEEGRKIEIACALCYVESARMKSPVQINRFLNDRESVIREFFANRSGGSIKDKVASAEQKVREELAKQHPDGLIGKNDTKVDILSAPMSHMQSKYAQYIRDAKKEAKKSYELTAHERSELEAALDMSVSDFTSAEGLEWLAKNHRDIFDAYTSFVRNATHSKGIENDTWWRAGDSDAIGDNLIAQMNSENGLRSQSWSDFQVIHLLDYIAATIELSTKGAKRQSYTKVPDYVKLLGNTGDMINMSLIPISEFSGKLAYDPVEGMAYDIAKQLRDEYHRTVGTICIGINNEQIRMLLEDATIDMVIPYHSSSMSKDTRKLMHIPKWKDFQKYQSEKKLSDADAKARAKEYGVELKKDAMYQKAPKFSEWFDLEEARQIAKMENASPSDMEAYKKYGKMYGGYMAMQNADNNYLKLCAERGLAPKFSAKESDFTHDANYWKLLIDRKMVDNVTGEIIEQMPIKPIFNEQSILEILNDELARYEDVKADQEYAAQTVLRKFLSGDMKVDKSTLEALQNPVDNVTKVNILESAEGGGVLFSDRFNTENNDIRYSRRTSNEELASMDDTALYIKNTKNANYIKMIFNGAKTEETRSRRTLDAFIGKNFYVTDGEYVYGSIVMGEPHKYTESDFHKRENQLKHRVPKGDDYDIKKGGIKWAYPIESYEKFDRPKKLSDSKEYNNSFQARQVLYSDRDDGYAKLNEMQAEFLQLSEKIREIEGSTEYDKAMDDFLEAERSGDSDNAVAEYNKRLDEMGYTEAYERKKVLQDEINKLSAELKAEAEREALDTERKAIEKSGLSEADYFRKQAVKEFGYTPYFYDAGYITPNGKMLNFSGEKGQHYGSRGQDHRAIGIVYANVQGGKAMIKFMGEGNVRIMAESPGIDISSSVEPTKEQYATIRKFVREYADQRFFNVDLTNAEGQTVGNYVYEGRISAERVANDIKYFFENGTTREQSSVAQFLFSDRETTNIYDIMGERDRLKKRNEILEADIKRLKEMSKLDKRVTMGAYLDRSKLSAIAKHIKKISDSTIAEDALVERLNEVYSSMRNAADYTWNEIYGRFYSVAEEVLAEAKPKTLTDDFAKMILKDIRATRISLTESQKKKAQYIFGKNWNRHFFNRVTITDSGASIDSQWQEWAKQYPYLFKTDISDADMIKELYDVIITLQDASVITEEYDEQERINWLAMEIYNKHWTANPLHTTADKYDAQIKVLKFEHRKAMEELRADYEARLKGQHKADKDKHRQLMKELRGRKDNEIAIAKQHGRDMLDKYKDNAERKTRIQRITANVLTLKDMLVVNSKDKHIPDAMKGPVTALINAMDFSSKRLIEKGVPTQKDIALQNALRKVSDMMVANNSALQGVTDLYGVGLDAEIIKMMKNVDRISDSLNGKDFVLQMMSLEDLTTLDKMVKVVKSSVNKLNQFHVAKYNAGVRALAIATAEDVDGVKKLYKDHKKHFDKLKTKLYWNNLNPYYAFKNLGTHAMKIMEALMDGQDKVAFLAKEIIDFAESVYSDKEYKKWSDKFFEFEIRQPSGKVAKFSMNVPQIMSLYCVSKQDDAKRHLLYGSEDADDFGKGRGITLVETNKTEAIRKNIQLTEADLNSIIANLDEVDRAKEVADKLQEYMSTRGAELGNEISMARWGIKSFGIKDYFPIKVSDGQTPDKGETPGVQGNPLVALLNMSFTHARNQFASQSIEIGDVFDVFSNHMASMIQYNAMALPVLDMYKWMNWKGDNDFGEEMSVKTSVVDTFGVYAWGYINTLLKDINGTTKDITRDSLGLMFFKNAKVAKVAFKIRVSLLQFTSYIRAGAVMDNKYLFKAFLHKPKIEHSQKYCGMSLWKSLGYFDTDITRPLTDKIKHTESVVDKIKNFSLAGAGKADEITLGYLWNACELEIRDTRKDLQVGSKEFFKEVGLRLREVIYQTQVVDSQLSRSQMMRGSAWDKMLTSFASENALSFNLVTDVYVTNKLDERRLGKKKSYEKNKKRTRKAIIAYAASGVITAALQTMFDAFTDFDEDDKDEEYFAKLMAGNFVKNVSFLEKIPYINLASSFLSGFSASRLESDWLNNLVKFIKQIPKVVEGKEGSLEKLIRYLLQSSSDATGIGVYAIYQQVKAFINLFDEFLD